MNKTTTTLLAELMAPKLGQIDPTKFEEEEFDLYSIPAFDARTPEVLIGSQIGSAKQIVQSGDVMLSKIVPHIRRAWVVGPKRGRRQIASGEWIVFRSDRFDPDYLRFQLVGEQFHRQFLSTVSGVGGSLMRARPSYVAKIPILLPPLAEQRRIAAILNKADALRRKAQQALDLTDDLIRSTFLDMFGDPVTNPKELDALPLKDVLKVKSGEFLPAKNMDAAGTFPVYGGNGISGRHSEYLFEESRIVIGRVGAYCGVVHRTPAKSWITDNALFVDHVLIELNLDFLEWALRLLNLNRTANAFGQPLISGSRIYPILLPIPPRENQDRFSEVVRRVSKASIHSADQRNTASTFFDCVLQRAFTGGL